VSDPPRHADDLGAGAIARTHSWYRDPLDTSNQTISLSSPLEFVVVP